MKQEDFLVRSTIGATVNGIVVSHFVKPDADKTLCGKLHAKMSSRYRLTSESGACKICWKRMLVLTKEE